MSPGALVVLALGVAMDATAVAAARGACAARIRVRDAALVALLFGGFHAVMPFVGALAGTQARSVVERWDHWIAFALLVVIGGRMIWSARRAPAAEATLAPIALLGLAVATSIDALAVGITLPLLDVSIVAAIAMIGGVTAVGASAGLFIGHRFGARIAKRFDVLGGLVLIGLGTKLLLEHLLAGR